MEWTSLEEWNLRPIVNRSHLSGSFFFSSSSSTRVGFLSLTSTDYRRSLRTMWAQSSPTGPLALEKFQQYLSLSIWWSVQVSTLHEIRYACACTSAILRLLGTPSGRLLSFESQVDHGPTLNDVHQYAEISSFAEIYTIPVMRFSSHHPTTSITPVHNTTHPTRIL